MNTLNYKITKYKPKNQKYISDQDIHRVSK